MSINRGFRSSPTIVLPDGSTLSEHRGGELLDKLRDLGFASRLTRTSHTRRSRAYRWSITN